MKQIILLAFAGIFLAFFNEANADAAILTKTNVYFERNGQPINQAVEFSVNCYGYQTGPPQFQEKQPGTYTPELVYSFSATCPQYGCAIWENYYLNYRHIDYCNLEGETGGKKFSLERYTSNPLPECQKADLPFDISDGENYYKEGPGFMDCMKSNNYDTSKCKDHLTLTPKSQMELNDKGFPVERKCTLKVDIVQKTVGTKEGTESPDSPTTPQKQKNGFWRSLWCSFIELFGKSCARQA